MNSSNWGTRARARSKLPAWKSWPSWAIRKLSGLEQIHRQMNPDDDDLDSKMKRKILPKRKVSFSIKEEDETRDYNQKDYEEHDQSDPLRKRNLSVSNSLLKQLNGNRHSRFIPTIMTGLSEMQASYRSPSSVISKPLPPWNNKIHMFNGHHNDLATDKVIREDLHNPRRDLDAASEIKKMKSRILAGENVAIEEIKSLRHKMGAEFIEVANQRKNTLKNVTIKQKRQKLFCIKGIVHIPAPHKHDPKHNSFGMPMDLRISLSNQDNPEHHGRRRLFFDFCGYRDEDIKLFLENNRRLIIEASRSQEWGKPAISKTKVIDLPKDLPVDNLRIVKDVFGTIIVEEAWKFN